MTGNRTAPLVAWIFIAVLLLPAAAAGTDCRDVDRGPITDFTYAAVPAESAPIPVNFYSTSDGGRNRNGSLTDPVESFLWRFGDGDTSEKANPLHTYAMSSARYQAEHKPYAVTLTAKTECGRINSTTKNVSVYCLGQKAGFAISQPVGDGPFEAPVALVIRDTSLHADDAVTTYHYTLWDAGMTRLFKESTEKDPAFVIRNRGNYVIRQEVFKACSNPPAENTRMEMNIEVTGSAAADEVPMETIPFTTPATTSPPAVPEYTATVTQPATPAPAPSVPLPGTTGPAAAPPGPAPGTGTLSVITTPAGARVYVNDLLLGESPATVRGFAAGRYSVRLEKSGYRTKTVRVEIGDDKLTEYSTALEPDSGWTGIVPIAAGVLVLAAGSGAVYWYRKKRPAPAGKRPEQPGQD